MDKGTQSLHPKHTPCRQPSSLRLTLSKFYDAYGFPVVFVMQQCVYGHRCQQLYRIIPRTLLSARTGKPMQLHGGGNFHIRAFTHIKDVVRATLPTS